MRGRIAAAGLLCVLVSGWNVVRADVFVAPYDGDVFIRGVGGTGGGRSDFGLGTSTTDFKPYLFDLPKLTNPVDLGVFHAGQVVPFAMKSTFGETDYAFSTDTTTPQSRTAFMDLDNSLKLGGSVVEQIGPADWVLHLDDAVSYIYDDNDNDLLVQIHVEPVPEPGLCSALAAPMMLLRRRRATREP